MSAEAASQEQDAKSADLSQLEPPGKTPKDFNADYHRHYIAGATVPVPSLCNTVIVDGVKHRGTNIKDAVTCPVCLTIIAADDKTVEQLNQPNPKLEEIAKELVDYRDTQLSVMRDIVEQLKNLNDILTRGLNAKRNSPESLN